MDRQVNRPADIGPEEWEIRCDLAALYRLVAHYRMTDLIYTHISARLPGAGHHFLINDYRRMFHEMRASDLVKIDLDGNKIDEKSRPDQVVNRAGFVIHSALHANREDLICIVHTHTRAGIAVASQKCGLLPMSQHALKFHGHLAYHNYEGIALGLDERERLVRDLGPDHRAMILRNHGLLVGGRTIPEAFDHIYFLEKACEAQLAAQSGGAELVLLPDEEIQEHTAAQYRHDEIPHWVDMAWTAALRLIAPEKSDVWT
ncbi:class II aldolase/adducin family protein [Xanthobacter aminoxidans]|uniref:class II aldolase/adducin family protein n=1 Tax=Xanthobacter aminoxidans TaxID=186280 RepID=UPI00372A707E